MSDNDDSRRSTAAGEQHVPPALDRSLGFLLSWVAADASAYYARALADLELAPQHVGVLTLLSDGPLVQARLSERLSVFQPVMVRLVNELEVMGLVERRRHPHDGRAVLVHLLPAGRRRLRRADAVSREATDDYFGPLSDREREALRGMLARLASHHGAGRSTAADGTPGGAS